MNTAAEIAIGILIACAGVIITIQHYELLSNRADIATYQQQINMLKIDSERQAEDTKAAYESAQTQVRRIQDKAKGIMLAKVSPNCDQSIKWLINQAHSL